MALVIPANIRRQMAGLSEEDAQSQIDIIIGNIDSIYEERASQTDLRRLYDMTFTLVTNQYGQRIYDAVKRTIENHTEGLSEQVQRQSDESFLQRLLALWEKYRKSLSAIRDMLQYLDENYVEKTHEMYHNLSRSHQQQQSDNIPLPTIYNCGIQIFKEAVLLKLTDRVQRLMISMIQEERNGGKFSDRFMLKNLTQMMIEVDKLQVYIDGFEQQYLIETRNFYRREAQQVFNDSSAVQYLRHAKQRLREEVDRNDRYFASDTRAKVEDVLKIEMIDRYKDMVIKKEGSGVMIMLENHEREELKLMYEMLSLVKDALIPMIDMVREYAKNEGLKIVKDSRKDKIQPMQLVMETINLRVSFDDLLLESFSTYTTGSGVPPRSIDIVLGKVNPNTIVEKVRVRDKDFSRAIKEAFDHVVNVNERFPEYLSLLLDTRLAKGSTQTTAQTDEQLDTFFDRVVMILRHIREKDVFERYYKNHLARRLLSGRSASDDDEKLFLTKLKTEFGYQFTSKLEGMFKDVKVSNELMKNWKQQQGLQDQKLAFDLSVQVLTHVYWPLSSSSGCELFSDDNPSEIGRQLTQSRELFSQFYVENHSGRKLSWQYNMGSADLRANGFARTYEFNVSTYQMIILLLYNNDDGKTTDNDGAITLADIEHRTKIPLNDLKRNLVSLLLPMDKNMKQSRILVRLDSNNGAVKTKEGEETDNEDDNNDELKRGSSGVISIDRTTRFKCNENFESRKIKNRVKNVSKKQSKEEQAETNEKISEERKWVTDAVIVRIMKMRKKMEHRVLVHEVIEQLHHRFHATSQFIKRRIDNLIEREYMERLEGDRQMYNYLA